MKKLFHKVHLWFALPFGLIISIVCFSGAMLVFEKDINALLGEEERLPFFRFMFRLHRWLLDVPARDGSIEWGKIVVGISTLMFVTVLVSGIVVWFPRTKKMLKNRLGIRTDKGIRRFWYDLHVVGGMYALVFLLVMSLTGLTWSFSWYAKPFYGMFGADVPVHRGKHRVKAAHVLSFGNENDKTQAAGFEKSLVRHTPSETYRSENSRVQHSQKVRRTIRSLHVGAWGGFPVKVLYFVAAMIGATLPITGYYMWYKRRFRKRAGI